MLIMQVTLVILISIISFLFQGPESQIYIFFQTFKNVYKWIKLQPN